MSAHFPADPAAVQADDALLDGLGAGKPASWFSSDDPVTDVLARWRDDVDDAPITLPSLPVSEVGAAKHALEPPSWEWLGSVARVLDPVLGLWPRSREQWREAAAWAGDVVEDATAAALIFMAWAVGVALVVAVAWFSPGWLRVLLVVCVATGWEVAVRLRRAARQVDEIAAELARGDGQ